MRSASNLSILTECLERAGRVLKKRIGKVSVSHKGPVDLVTQADFESQRTILSILRRRAPTHDYVAEEKGLKKTGSQFVWVIDPLDGTVNYAHGYPVSCVSIGLLCDGRPIAGGVYDPFRDECFVAEKGRGARLNGRRIQVTTARLKDSLLVTGFPYDRAQRSHFYVELYRRILISCHDVRRSGSAALDLAWIAAGRADGFWEFGLRTWDVAAGKLLVEEAGGRVSDFSGTPWSYPNNFGEQTLATNGRLHEGALRILRDFLKSERRA